MSINEQTKIFLKTELQYDYKEGSLIWVKSGLSATTIVRKPGGLIELVVDTSAFQKAGEEGIGILQAASVCWFLRKRTWPNNGVELIDRKPDRPNALRLSNLRRVGKREAIKASVKSVESDLVRRLIDFLNLTVTQKTREGLLNDENVAHLVVQEMQFIKELENVMKGVTK